MVAPVLKAVRDAGLSKFELQVENVGTLDRKKTSALQQAIYRPVSGFYFAESVKLLLHEAADSMSLFWPDVAA